MRLSLRLIAACAGVAFSLLAIWQLESERDGLTITQVSIGSTPATIFQRVDIPKAPAIVIAHGFAGSRQLMEAFALTLAQAGYVAVTFDFEGHGKNPTPMSGDLTSIDGTTRRLMTEIGHVTDAALALPSVDGRVALLGHSMASDIIVRRAREDPRIAATVAISMYSEAVTADAPRNLLMITGAWEPYLRRDALRNARLAEPLANEGQTIGDPAQGRGRRTVVAPRVEHVGVLYSATALTEARAWLDAVFGRVSTAAISSTGGWILLLLASLVLLAWPLAGVLPQTEPPPPRLPIRTFVMAILIPAVVTPLLLTLVDTRVLPVLVADYLAAHLFVFGMLSLAIMLWNGVRLGRVAWMSAIALAGYGIFVFGLALDRYAASFMPVAARLPIMAAVAIGTVPYMLADSLLSEGGRAPLLRVLAARGAFVASLGAAVALDPARLFFLLIIIPVIVLFFLIFGLIGGWVGRRTHSSAAVGIGLGLILAWSVGASFPMFSQ